MTYSVLGIDTQTDEQIVISQSARRQGLYIIGSTGQGKTGLIENLIIQDIKQGVGVCLLDPHGDLTRNVLARIPQERIDNQDVIYLDIAEEDYPFGLNFFTCDNPKSAKAVQRVVDQVMHIFEKLFDISRQTPRMAQYLRNCTYTLVANPGYTMADIPLLLTDARCRQKLVANVTDPNVQLFWKRYDALKPSEQQDYSDAIINKLDEFLQPLTRNIVGQAYSTIDLRTVMDERKILLVTLDPLLESVTSLIGSVLVALFLNAAYSRSDIEDVRKRKQFNLYADEFQRFATEDFATLLTEARKFGIATTIAHQARFQPGMTEAIRATSLQAANLVMFRITSQDANELAGNFDCRPVRTKRVLKQRTKPIFKEWDEWRWDSGDAEKQDAEFALSIAKAEQEIMEARRKKLETKVRFVAFHALEDSFIVSLGEYRHYHAYRDDPYWTWEPEENFYKHTPSWIWIDGKVNGLPYNPTTSSFEERAMHEIARSLTHYKTENGVEWYTFSADATISQLEDIVRSDVPGYLDHDIGKLVWNNGELLWEESVWGENLVYWRKEIMAMFLSLREQLAVEARSFFTRYYQGKMLKFYPDKSGMQRTSPEWILRGRWETDLLPKAEVVSWGHSVMRRLYEQVRQCYPELEDGEQELRRCQDRLSHIRGQREEYTKQHYTPIHHKDYLGEQPEVEEKTRISVTRPVLGYSSTTESVHETPFYEWAEERDQTYDQKRDEIANELSNLSKFTARVKIATEEKLLEHTVRTLEPERGVGRAALQERIRRIQSDNRDHGCCQKREDVEEAILRRQAQCSQQPDEPPDAIYRHPPR